MVDGDYHGLSVHQAARIALAAHGGQVAPPAFGACDNWRREVVCCELQLPIDDDELTTCHDLLAAELLAGPRELLGVLVEQATRLQAPTQTPRRASSPPWPSAAGTGYCPSTSTTPLAAYWLPPQPTVSRSSEGRSGQSGSPLQSGWVGSRRHAPAELTDQVSSRHQIAVDAPSR